MMHWTFDQYDDAPADRLERLMTYVGIKSAVEREHSESQSKGGGATGRR